MAFKSFDNASGRYWGGLCGGYTPAEGPGVAPTVRAKGGDRPHRSGPEVTDRPHLYGLEGGTRAHRAWRERGTGGVSEKYNMTLA